MPLPVFERLQTDNEALNRIQDRIERPIRALVSIPTLDGVLLEELELLSGLNNLEHTLGRPLRGYQVVRSTAPLNVSDDATESPRPDMFHRLQASASATVSLWVF